MQQIDLDDAIVIRRPSYGLGALGAALSKMLSVASLAPMTVTHSGRPGSRNGRLPASKWSGADLRAIRARNGVGRPIKAGR